MKTIQFLKEDKNHETFSSSLRKNVNNYFKENQISPNGNATMYFKTIAMVILYLVPFILILTIHPSGLLAFGLTILMGIGVAGTGMGVMHDAVHG